MAIVITDKRKIDRPWTDPTHDVLADLREHIIKPEPEKKISLIEIWPETLQKCQSEAIRGWLYSVMPDQRAEARSV